MTSVESLSPAGKISDSVIYFYIKKIWLFYEKLLKYLNLLATLRKLKKKTLHCTGWRCFWVLQVLAKRPFCLPWRESLTMN